MGYMEVDMDPLEVWFYVDLAYQFEPAIYFSNLKLFVLFVPIDYPQAWELKKGAMKVQRLKRWKVNILVRSWDFKLFSVLLNINST